MKYLEILQEEFAQKLIHRNTTISVLKALAKHCSTHTSRFIIDEDGKLHGADAEEFTHYEIWSPGGVRGWVYWYDDGSYKYKAVGMYNMYQEDHPLLRYFEKAGIERIGTVPE